MRHFILFIFILLTANVNAQLDENFSDGNITQDPTWEGDVSDFIVNDEDQLQLNAPEAGSSFLYTAVEYPNTDLHFQMQFEMDFSPSGSNNLFIYLGLSQPDIETASGFYLKVGEDGSNDAIEFYLLTNGESEKIGSATMGAVSAGPVMVALDINYIDKNWEIYAAYDGGTFFGIEPEIIADNYSLATPHFFGIQCNYTSSRTDLFYFDNFLIESYKPDEVGPVLEDLTLVNDQSLQLTFNEILDQNSLEGSFSVAPDNELNNVDFDPEIPNIVLLTFADPFDSQELNTLRISNVKDLSGNDSGEILRDFFFARKAEQGDLVINEVLTDPIGDGSDFFELYNLTSDFIDLSGCRIINRQSDSEETIGGFSIAPFGYIAFTEDVEQLIEQYQPIADANIKLQDLPAFNNSSANFTFVNAEGVSIDSFDYDDNFHLANLDQTEGVALEKIDPNGSNEGPENWTSAAASVHYGTPGYKNSSLLTSNSEAIFSLVNKSFSPNMDGDQDLLGISYNLEKSGYISNIVIYDAEGNEVKRLHNNQSLSTSGVITWNGSNNDGVISDIGMYIAIGELFHNDGSTKYFKLAFALLDFIE